MEDTPIIQLVTLWFVVLIYIQTGSGGDLLLAVDGEASHGTAPLGWDICWFTTRRYDGPMAGPHRRYSYPRHGDSELSW